MRLTLEYNGKRKSIKIVDLSKNRDQSFAIDNDLRYVKKYTRSVVWKTIIDAVFEGTEFVVYLLSFPEDRKFSLLHVKWSNSTDTVDNIYADIVMERLERYSLDRLQWLREGF